MGRGRVRSCGFAAGRVRLAGVHHIVVLDSELASMLATDLELPATTLARLNQARRRWLHA